ncbi:hypothetical protein AB1285_19060 [Microbacterium sp. NRRL B-14842]|uniref:hypothetical protein n=1 Tax=Microbacterium sp. NRRL B-14842 TaxID=3162881 RepID=UPI003D26BC50
MTDSPAPSCAAACWIRLTPLLLVRHREVAESRRVRKAFQMRDDLLRMSVDHADGLEHAIAPLRAQLADAEGGGRGVHLRERVGVVVTLLVGGDGTRS